jgi:hypothetical protein
MKKTYIIIIVLLILATTLFVVQKTLIPDSQPSISTQTPTPTPTKPLQPHITAITFTTPFPTPPPVLTVYLAESQTAASFAQNLIGSLNLEPHPLSKNLWQKDGISLSVSEKEGLINLNRNVSKAISPGVELESAIRSASTFAESLLLNSIEVDSDNILLIDNRLDYLSQTPQQNISPNEAYRAIIPFSFVANNIPLRYTDQSRGSMMIQVNANYEVEKITFQPPPTSLTPKTEHAPLPPNTVEARIKSGLGTIINMDPEMWSQTTVDIATINSIELEYRLNSEDMHVTPYYLLSGTARSGHISSAIEITFLAIELL